jgi:hypothetical protein
LDHLPWLLLCLVCNKFQLLMLMCFMFNCAVIVRALDRLFSNFGQTPKWKFALPKSNFRSAFILANLHRVGEFNFVISCGSIGNADWKLDLNTFGTWCELIGNIKIQKIQLPPPPPPPKGLVGLLLPCLPFLLQLSTKYPDSKIVVTCSNFYQDINWSSSQSIFI